MYTVTVFSPVQTEKYTMNFRLTGKLVWTEGTVRDSERLLQPWISIRALRGTISFP